MKTNLTLLARMSLVSVLIFPGAQQAAETPLPSVDTVLKRVVDTSEKENENDRAFNQHYAYTRMKVTEYRNARGELKKHEEKTSRNSPALAPVAFRPAPSETKAEPEKSAGKKGAVTDANSNVRGKAFEKKDFALNDELLGRFQFTLAGRETVNGRPALVLEFKPRKSDLPERNIKDRFINKAAGRLWVDEGDSVLVKAAVHLTEKVNVVGGLVGSIWKFDYGFDRVRTADGLWFTHGVDWHLEGREVIVRRTVDYHEGKSEVRKAW
jgi:hypothetical protein